MVPTYKVYFLVLNVYILSGASPAPDIVASKYNHDGIGPSQAVKPEKTEGNEIKKDITAEALRGAQTMEEVPDFVQDIVKDDIGQPPARPEKSSRHGAPSARQPPAKPSTNGAPETGPSKAKQATGPSSPGKINKTKKTPREQPPPKVERVKKEANKAGSPGGGRPAPPPKKNNPNEKIQKKNPNKPKKATVKQKNEL